MEGREMKSCSPCRACAACVLMLAKARLEIIILTKPSPYNDHLIDIIHAEFEQPKRTT